MHHDAAPRGDRDGALQHREIMSAMDQLKSLIAPQEELTQAVIDSYRKEMEDAKKLKAELDMIHEAINATKKEIATLHVTGFEGPEMTRVTHELDAVVHGTEHATDRILTAAEQIDQSASTLSARLKDDQDRDLLQDMQDQVIKIFEACNFQDLTGQRITKVVATLKFIETHIVRMMDIWGGLDSFNDVKPEAMAIRDGDKKLLNGPKLEDDIGHASQNDIDALFN